MTKRLLSCFRPRFSIRTLVVVVTLVYCYAACWGPTKKQGVEDVYWHAVGDDLHSMQSVGVVTPLLVRTVEKESPHRPFARHVERAYLWFFGYVAKLPWERDIEPNLFVTPPFPPTLSRPQ